MTHVSHASWVLPWWRWIFQLSILQVVLVCLAITPFGLWAVRALIQGIVKNPLRYDWMSFNFDVFLGLAVGPMLWLSYRMPADAGLHGHAYAWLNYGSILGWVAFAIFHMWQERKDTPTWSERLGATSVYHFAVFVFFAPLNTVLFVNTWGASWTQSPLYFAAHLAPILAFAAWLWAGMFYDAKHRLTPEGQLKFVVTSPVDGWRNVRLVVQPVWKWLSVSTKLDEELETFRFSSFIINRKPIQGLLVLLMVSPGMFFVLNAVMYGEWLPIHYQWYSAIFGDPLLDVFGAVLLAMIAWIRPRREVEWLFYNWPWNFAVMGFWACFSMYHMWQERASVSLTQHLGAASLYHNVFVYLVLGYALTTLWLAVMKFGNWLQRVLGVVALVGFVGGWVLLGFYDGQHQYAPTGINKSWYTSPVDGWRNVRLLLEFIGHVFHVLF